ncbi:anti-sigma factor [Heliobacterium undosum]|uniref:Anti-sigma factor n=1 Tax=Heliomicrobium undosum TaxID=121734 RepID=A0A845L5H9_9FIRM|nr:anti-sigma factor [Heliomicrobium undosum]MZP29920.1 anti-sigma factor [Heliomicrobium undosum]
MNSLNSRWKKILVATSATALLASALTLPPVQQATADFLSLFRVQRMQAVKITQEQLDQMAQTIRSHVGEVDLQQFGAVEIIEKPEFLPVTLGEAQKRLPFAVKQPSQLPNGLRRAETVTLFTGGLAEFRLQADQVNRLLEGLGAQDLIPPDLSGKAFRVGIPAGARLVYERAEGGQAFLLDQFASPEMTVPPGLDAAALRKSLLNLPILPADLRSQLAAIDDWQRTMVVPYAEGRMEKVDIGGTEALFAKNVHSGQSCLFWVDSGILYRMEGELDREGAVRLARSLR